MFLVVSELVFLFWKTHSKSMNIDGFGKHFGQLCKANFSQIKHLKQYFPDTKQKNCPRYYLVTIRELTAIQPYIAEQLLLTLLLALNFFHDETTYKALKEELPASFIS